MSKVGDILSQIFGKREEFATFSEGIPIEILDATTHSREWPKTEADLDAIVESYNASYHEAQATLDHKEEGPSGGSVRSVFRKGTKLFAVFGKVQPWLKDKVLSGEYPHRSVELYLPGNKSIPGGKPYLKNVSFLGAMTPASKGLSPVVSFSDSSDKQTTSIFQSDFRDGNGRPIILVFNENPTSVKDKNTMPTIEELTTKMGEQSTQILTLSEENKALKADIAKFKEVEEARVKAEKETRVKGHVERLVTAKKVLPAQVESLTKLFSELSPEMAKFQEEMLMKGPDVVPPSTEGKTDPPPANGTDTKKFAEEADAFAKRMNG